MSKNCSLEETEPSYDQKFFCSDNFGQNNWNKVKRSSKIGRDFKGLISAFAYFMTALGKVLFLGGRLGTRLCLHPNLRIFKSLKSFANS